MDNANVFLHTRESPRDPWQNTARSFLRLPVVGEHLATESDSPWYEVQLVVHAPFDSTYDAEVYATKVDSDAVMQQALGSSDSQIFFGE
jgi:hypothetical protein